MSADERRKHLFARQKRLEREMARLQADGADRRSRRWNELEGEYAEVVEALERLDAACCED